MDTAQEIRVNSPNRPHDSDSKKDSRADDQQGGQHQGPPGQLCSIELLWPCHILHKFPSISLVFQFAVSAGQGSHTDGKDDGIHHGQIVEQEYPTPFQILGILPGKERLHPDEFYRQYGGAHQNDLPPAAFIKFQFQHFHRLATFPASSKKMSSRFFCCSSSRMTPRCRSASNRVN